MKPFSLDTEPKIKNGFTVPESYFEQFSEQINSKISQQETKVIALKRRKKMIYYAVAAVLMFALSIPVFNYYHTTSTLTQSEVEDYITLQSGISEDDLVNLLDQEAIKNLKIDLKIEDQQLEETLLNNPNLEEYILN